MSLATEIQAIIAASGAQMSLAARHIESDQEINIDADRVFPLCSVLKIPVLVEAFRQMADGRFTLDDRWELTVTEKNLPSGVLLFFDDGLQPTVRDLLTLMIIISDNTATDMVMHRLGTENINRYIHSLGLTNTHITMTIREIFEDIMPSADPTQDLLELARQRQKTGINRSGRAYSLGPDNDVGTPADLTRLLTMIFQGEIVSRAACDEMLKILLKQQLNDRLPRFLPPGTPVAHKTGTLAGYRNDSGIIYVNDESHVAVTVFSAWDDQATSDDQQATSQQIFTIDSAFGQIGRLIFDYFS